jgi:hypothetical protein
MRSVRCLTLSIVVLALALSTALSPVALAAPAVWSGFTYSFAHTVAAPDQDEITPNVTITRQATGGLYNAVSESAYALDISPKNTLWATTYNNPGAPLIAATEWSGLNFTDWRTAYGGAGNLATNILAASGNAVVYLPLDDVYLDLKFTNWSVGFSGGGEFAYLRGEPSIVPEPATMLLAATAVLAFTMRRRRK